MKVFIIIHYNQYTYSYFLPKIIRKLNIFDTADGIRKLHKKDIPYLEEV